MKAWLLAFVAVAALVCMDPAYTLKCCTMLGCFTSMECREGQNFCISVHRKDDILGLRRIRTCAENCTYPEPVKSICCCTGDRCNILL